MLFILLASPPHPRAILCSGLCPGAPGNGFTLCFLAPSRIQAVGKLKEMTRAWKSRGPILCCIFGMSLKASTPGSPASTSPTFTKPGITVLSLVFTPLGFLPLLAGPCLWVPQLPLCAPLTSCPYACMQPLH